MKHLYLLSAFIIGLFFVQCTEKYPKTIERPDTGLRNSETLEIDKVILTDSTTVLYIDAYFYPGNWILIDSATYIQANGQKYIVESSEGIKLDDKFHMPENGEHKFTLTFPPLPKGTKSFDFIESDCDDCFKIWDVDITGKAKSYKLDVPSDVANTKIDENATFPKPVFKSGKTKLTVHFTGLREGFNIQNQRLYVNNILTGERDELDGTKETNNKYVFEFYLYTTSPINLFITTGYYTFFLNPGEEAEMYIDMTAATKQRSRYNSQKNIKSVGFKGELADINTQIASIDMSKVDASIIDMPDASFADMSKSELFDYLFKVYNDKVKKVDTTQFTLVQKQYLRNSLKTGLVNSSFFIRSIHKEAYRMKNNLEWSTPMPKDYKAFEIEENDILRFKNIGLNDSLLIYSDAFGHTGNNLVSKTSDKTLNEITGSEKGLLQDLKIAQPLLKKASAMQVLTTEEESKLTSASSPYYAELAKTMYNNAKKQYDEAMAKGGFVIEETPRVANNKLLDAIVAKYKGKAVFVDFWATWCGPCLSSMKTIKPIKPQMAEKGVVSIYITGTSSPKSRWTSMLGDIGGNHYYLEADQWDALGNQYGIKGIPTYMIFDKSGKKTYQTSGYPGNDKILEELLKVW